ncbi:hypothetical protein ACFTUC_36600 [Streptomyces sp. NPDC056944]
MIQIPGGQCRQRGETAFVGAARVQGGEEGPQVGCVRAVELVRAVVSL